MSGTQGDGDGDGRSPRDDDGSRFDLDGDARGRWTEWLLLRGDRLHVAAGSSLLVLVVFALLELAGVIPLRESSGIFYVFSGFIGGNLTLVTVVVSINQLLLSRELNTPGELRSQIGSLVEYRRDVEDAAGRVAPVEPPAFLRLLFESTRQEAQRLGGLSFDGTTPEEREEIDDLVTAVTEHADGITDLLRRSGTSTFDVVSVTLTTNYAREINHIRRFLSVHGDELSEQVADALDRLVDRFRGIDVARQYFKSVYL